MRARLTAFAVVLAMVAVACGGGSDDADAPDPTSAPPTAASGDAASGESLYVTCAACHGPDATGVEGLGKSLIGSEFVNSNSDADLIEFLKVGRPTSDPLNTTGVDMPPKGGNPSLDDGDLLDIVAFLRSVN